MVALISPSQLDKADLCLLVQGIGIGGYDNIQTLSYMGLGSWTGGFVDKWTWSNAGLNSLSEASLWDLYNKLKNGDHLEATRNRRGDIQW